MARMAGRAVGWSAFWFRWVKRLQRLASPSLMLDRQAFLDNVAARTQHSMQMHDHRTAYTLAQGLGAPR
eukprot:9980022-Karenia_brevis.AAC.1